MAHTAHIVFLTANDVYKLLPDDDGMGGVAQFATLIDRVRGQLPRDAHVIVTMNGDFLWRTDLEPPNKAELMVKIMHEFGVEYAVLGNHEFDFGVPRFLELLPTMKFTMFGSNARIAATGELLPGVQDVQIITLPGVKIGLFGVLTSTPHEFIDITSGVPLALASEVVHAKRCVGLLLQQGADVIVALTHTRLQKDRLIARQVPGIHLILGGHDHDASTMFEKATLIHKSGCDALWLAQIDVFITKTSYEPESEHVDVQFGWTMHPNRGCVPKPSVQRLVDEYLERTKATVDPGDLVPFAVSSGWLDCTMATVRSQECALGNLVADAIRVSGNADVAFINGGFLQGERRYRARLPLTQVWLREVLPIANTTKTVTVTAKALRLALLFYLKRYPDMSSTMPHVSGVYVVLAITKTTRSLRMYRDRDRTLEVNDKDLVVVASSAYVFDEAEGMGYFADHQGTTTGPIIRDAVASFLTNLPNGMCSYPAREGRLVVEED